MLLLLYCKQQKVGGDFGLRPRIQKLVLSDQMEEFLYSNNSDQLVEIQGTINLHAGLVSNSVMGLARPLLFPGEQ